MDSPHLLANDEYSWRRSWVRRHQHAVDIYYAFDIYDPSLGWISRPNLRNMNVFGGKVLNTNSKGFRGSKDFSYAKSPDRPRMVVLGDSFTFGDEVSDEETYSSYLQELLPHSEIMNLGVHGYGHDQMLILFRKEAVKYAPDIVVLGFLPGDMDRNLLAFRDFAKPRFVLEDDELKLTNTPVPRPEDVLLRSDWARPRILDFLSLVRFQLEAKVGPLSNARQKEMEAVTTAILRKIIEVSDEIHAVPVLVYLPIGHEISSPVAETQGEAYLWSVCRQKITARCVSARPHFREKIAQGQSFKETGHWDPAGQRTVAEAIRDYLVTEPFLRSIVRAGS